MKAQSDPANENYDVLTGLPFYVDEENELATAFGIQSIPTLVVVKNGEVVNKTVGVIAKSEIEQILNSL